MISKRHSTFARAKKLLVFSELHATNNLHIFSSKICKICGITKYYTESSNHNEHTRMYAHTHTRALPFHLQLNGCGKRPTYSLAFIQPIYIYNIYPELAQIRSPTSTTDMKFLVSLIVYKHLVINW